MGNMVTNVYVKFLITMDCVLRKPKEFLKIWWPQKQQQEQEQEQRS